MSATAGRYGLEPGLHVLMLGYRPIRDFPDWFDPPMDSNADWLDVPGAQFGDGPGQVNLQERFKNARVRERSGYGAEFLAWRGDGWLWAEQAGEYAFRIAAADDAGRMTVGGRQVTVREKGKPSENLSVTLQRGFHRIRLEGINQLWGIVLATEWKQPGQQEFAAIPAANVFRGHALVEGPRVFQAAVAGAEHRNDLRVAGGKPPYRYSVVGGTLPAGLSLSDAGRLSGRAAAPGFYRFTVAVRDGCGVSVAEPLGLRVLPAQTHRSRNDGEAIQISFDDADPKTLRGGLLAGETTVMNRIGMKAVGGYALYPWEAGPAGKPPAMRIDDGCGAFGSRRCAVSEGYKVLGFYLSGEQGQLMSDYMPALRRANRLGVALRVPEPVTLQTPAGPVTYDWRTDPAAFAAKVLPSVHMAGHNVTRYVNHEKEQWNWHFYHPQSRYWGDHWQAANVYYLGDGWYWYETCHQSHNQRQATYVILSGWYEPQQDTDARYFESLSRFYFVFDVPDAGVGAAAPARRCQFDQLRMWREAPGVEVRHSAREKVARCVVPPGVKTVDVPFEVTHTYPRPARWWVSKPSGTIPIWDGKEIFEDLNGNGAVDPGEPELDMQTPLLSPGQTRRFVYRVAIDKLELGQTHIAGVTLRVHDREDPLNLSGDSMMILLHRAADPRQVPRHSLTTFSKGPVKENLPPAAKIEGPRSLRVRVGQALELAGTVSDSDGPERPQPAWDFGDDSEIQYGPKVSHQYDRPGKYTVRLRACDSVLERCDEVTVDVAR